PGGADTAKAFGAATAAGGGSLGFSSWLRAHLTRDGGAAFGIASQDSFAGGSRVDRLTAEATLSQRSAGDQGPPGNGLKPGDVDTKPPVRSLPGGSAVLHLGDGTTVTLRDFQH